MLSGLASMLNFLISPFENGFGFISFMTPLSEQEGAPSQIFYRAGMTLVACLQIYGKILTFPRRVQTNLRLLSVIEKWTINLL